MVVLFWIVVGPFIVAVCVIGVYGVIGAFIAGMLGK
jgi:hypothetical protein